MALDTRVDPFHWHHMRSPIGDQKGALLLLGALVKRVSVSRLRSRTQISIALPPWAPRANATDFPSGEIAGSHTPPGAFTGLRDLPDRSYQPIWRQPAAPPVSYSSAPFPETATGK
jgi:hypothetical protein